MVGGQAVGVDHHPGGDVGVDRAAHDQDGLVGVALPLEVKDPVTGHRGRAHHADLEELEQALVKGLPLGSASSTARVRAFWSATQAAVSSLSPSSSHR